MAKVKTINENVNDLFDLLEEEDEMNEMDMSLFDDEFEEEFEDDVEVDFEPVTTQTKKQRPATSMSNPANKPARKVVKKEIELDDVEVEKPVKKDPVSKEIKVETKSAPKQVAVKKVESAKKGKVRVNTNKANSNSYDDLFKQVTDKVDKYNKVMEERANGSKAIPQSVVISKELLVSLLAAKFTEEQGAGLKQAMAKAMVSMGFDKEEVTDAVAGYSFKKVEVESLYNTMLTVFYDILSEGAGFPMFKNDDCTCNLKGNWTEPSLKDNAHLQTDKATYTESYLRVTSSSPAPASKKTLGTITANGKFRPDSK